MLPRAGGPSGGHKGDCTFRSLLSSRINSEPWMSCRTKMSLYSPKPSASSQAATSSEPHLSASREENHRGGLGPRRGSWMQQGRQQAAEGSGGGRLQPASPSSHPQLWQGQRLQQAQAGDVPPQLTYGASELPLDKTPSAGAGTYPKS